MVETIHFLIRGKEVAAKYNSTGHYNDGCLCGNGNFWAEKTRMMPLVTCEPCLAILNTEPEYLDVPRTHGP